MNLYHGKSFGLDVRFIGHKVGAETARLSSFVGCITVGKLVKITLGPKGMDKTLVGFGPNDG